MKTVYRAPDYQGVAQNLSSFFDIQSEAKAGVTTVKYGMLKHSKLGAVAFAIAFDATTMQYLGVFKNGEGNWQIASYRQDCAPEVMIELGDALKDVTGVMDVREYKVIDPEHRTDTKSAFAKQKSIKILPKLEIPVEKIGDLVDQDDPEVNRAGITVREGKWLFREDPGQPVLPCVFVGEFISGAAALVIKIPSGRWVVMMHWDTGELEDFQELLQAINPITGLTRTEDYGVSPDVHVYNANGPTIVVKSVGTIDVDLSNPESAKAAAKKVAEMIFGGNTQEKGSIQDIPEALRKRMHGSMFPPDAAG